MAKKYIKTLIEKGEGQDLEFKSKFTKDIGNGVCAFANTNDGTILVGVGNKGAIVGVSKKVEEQIASITDSCDPPVRVAIEIGIVDEKNILIVKVKKSGQVHSWKGKVYVRVSSTNRPLSMQEILELGQKLGKIRFDEQICEEASLDDIDWNFIKNEFIPVYETVSGKKIVGDAKELLESLSGIRNSKPTNAGILLFGKNPQKFFINSHIASARYKGEVEGIERLDYKEFTGNLFQQIDNCDEYIKEHIATMSRLLPYQVQRQDIPEYGLFSIRELITNAACHRDYFNQHSKVIIKMFSDRIEFYNPGGLPAGVTPKNITEKQFSRNPITAKVLAKVRYIEELGEGWNKIIDEHKKHPLKPESPKIKADDYSVLIILFSTKEKFEEKKLEIELNERQRKAVEYLKDKEFITTKIFANLINVSERQARYDLKDLVTKGVLIAGGKTTLRRYKLRQTSANFGKLQSRKEG
ncbi:MAG: putative DNA binding domain-containing protein [Candidatus Thermoplasmatota archaeon]|nr:putative DNA binding domain-containing protein [Candidatus Thermoplasmatota archaeon]